MFTTRLLNSNDGVNSESQGNKSGMVRSQVSTHREHCVIQITKNIKSNSAKGRSELPRLKIMLLFAVSRTKPDFSLKAQRLKELKGEVGPPFGSPLLFSKMVTFFKDTTWQQDDSIRFQSQSRQRFFFTEMNIYVYMFAIAYSALANTTIQRLSTSSNFLSCRYENKP